MPRKETTKHIQVYMSQDALEIVTEHANEHGYRIVVDYVRDLIKKDIEASGKSVDFGIDRGGYRGGPKAKPNEASVTEDLTARSVEPVHMTPVLTKAQRKHTVAQIDKPDKAQGA